LRGRAEKVVAAVQAAGPEGVIAKRKDSIYQPGERSRDCVKLKLEHQQEFVIGGYRPDGANGVDALLVGYYDGNSLCFAERFEPVLFNTLVASCSISSNRYG
jgi:bifunctional non-homologous end joining protein LigD